MNGGDQLGKYTLTRPLRAGAMGEVWVARHSLLGRVVAIKSFFPGVPGYEDPAARFQEEGKCQGELDHPNIVKAIDLFEQGGRQFLVMDFIDGESLDELIERTGGPLPLSRILAISLDVLAAVGYAHEHQIVHRDLKPSNILLDKAGKAYLSDFGVALAPGGRRMTRAGASVGTAEYISPEQVDRPQLVGGRSDLYSFGVVLYEMLTGRLPFEVVEGDHEFQLKYKHLKEDPTPPRHWNPAIPVEVEAVVLRALRKQPEERFQRAREFSDALLYAASPAPVEPPIPEPRPYTPPPPEPPSARTSMPSPAPVVVPPPQRSRGPVAIGVLLLIVLLAAGGWWYWSNRGEQPKVVFTPPPKQDDGKAADTAKTAKTGTAVGSSGDVKPVTDGSVKQRIRFFPPKRPARRVCTDDVVETLPSPCPKDDQFCKSCKAEKGIPDVTGIGR